MLRAAGCWVTSYPVQLSKESSRPPRRIPSHVGLVLFSGKGTRKSSHEHFSHQQRYSPAESLGLKVRGGGRTASPRLAANEGERRPGKRVWLLSRLPPTKCGLPCGPSPCWRVGVSSTSRLGSCVLPLDLSPCNAEASRHDHKQGFRDKSTRVRHERKFSRQLDTSSNV